MRQDLRDALRSLRRSPSSTGIALLTLGVGIGATTAIFSVLYSVLLRPLPYPDPGRIVGVQTRFVEEARQIPRLTGPDLVDVRGSATSLAAFGGYAGGRLGVQLGETAEFAGVYWVNAGLFEVFRVPPVAGRYFDDSTARDSAVVSAGFARRHFGSPQAAVGESLGVEGQSYVIVGVAGPPLSFPPRTEIWLGAPLRPESLSRTAFNYSAVARVAPELSVASAQAQVEGIGESLARAHPDSNRGRSFALVPLQEQLVGSARATLWLLLGASGLVLMIACANVANLLLARASGRVREMAVRAALGASRARIARQLLVESGLLALGGGVLGVLLARSTLGALVASLPEVLHRTGAIELAGDALAFALFVSLLCVVLFGLAPAWHASRSDLRSGLAAAGGRGPVGGRIAWTRHALVVGEVALAVLLAVGAGLLLRTLTRLGEVPLGYEAEGRLVATVHAPASTFDEYVAVAREMSGLGEALLGLPGVVSSGAAMGLPSGPYGSNGSYAVVGRDSFEEGQVLPEADFALAGPGYFRTLGIPILVGRGFEAGDLYEAPFVAVISETLARESFPGENPLGRQLQCGLDSDTPMTVVGVVGDVRQHAPDSEPGPTLYMALAQHPYYANEVQVVVHAEGEPDALVPAVRTAIHRLRGDAATSFTTLSGQLADSIATRRLRGRLAGLFAAVALLLAGAGVYGVMAFATAQRRSEMALRLALGARGGDVWRLVMGSGLRLVAMGLALGWAATLATGRVLESMVFGIEIGDLATWSAVVGVVLSMAVAAIALPARRAMRADPARVLRQE